jgi:hypothetical protein
MLLSLLAPLPPVPPDDTEGIVNPVVNASYNTGEEFLQDFLPKLIGIAFIVGVIVFFFVFIFGAIQWIASGGEKMAVEAARKKIFAAVIGLVIMFTVFAVAGLLGSYLDINILSIDISVLEID